jgi:DNA-binding NarL/FixJ family response regulator
MPPSKTIRVAIIDDNRLVRDALAAMLNELPDMGAVASALADATVLAATKPQVVVRDGGFGDQDTQHVATALFN